MKKLLLSSIVLFLFSACILLFQLSCKKTATATETPSTQAQNIGKILFKGVNAKEIYQANYDGSYKQKINFVFPAPTNANDEIEEATMSPDGKLVFLKLYSGSINKTRVYSCNIDGSSLKLVLDHTDFSQSSGFYGAY